MTTDQQQEWEFHLKIATENVGRDRKGNAQLRFVSASGEPVQGLEMQVTQRTQAGPNAVAAHTPCAGVVPRQRSDTQGTSTGLAVYRRDTGVAL